ncbi:MAG TPA: nitrile hydratase accessory protein [Burkholderiaceae bacterium]|nr:nitrile hydratase accessory protein [Burkholderiaceae bacterium]
MAHCDPPFATARSAAQSVVSAGAVATDVAAVAADVAAADGAPLLRAEDGAPVFAAPWQAQVFALTVALHERGCFEWREWAACLSRAIGDAQRAGDPDLGDTYYLHWLTALETMVRDKGIASPLALTALRQAWAVAAEKTPHGRPIELSAAIRRRLLGQAASDGA